MALRNYQSWRGIRKLVHYYWSRRFGDFGVGSTIRAPRLLTNPERVHIGDMCLISKDVRMDVLPLAEGEPVTGSIRIGNGVIIGEYSHLGAAAEMVIEDGAGIGAFSLVIDHDHTLVEDESVALLDGPLVAKPIHIGRRVWVGEGVKILKGVTIGADAVVAAGAIVVKDVAARDVVGGVPARSLKRAPVE